MDLPASRRILGVLVEIPPCPSVAARCPTSIRPSAATIPGPASTTPFTTGITARRRGRREDAIYFDATKNRYVGAISVGFGADGKRLRRKVTGRTKTEVRSNNANRPAQFVAGPVIDLG